MIDESPKHHTNVNGAGNVRTTSWTGKKLHEMERGAEEMGHSVIDRVWWGLSNLGKRGRSGDGAGDAATRSAGGSGAETEMEMETRKRRPTTADTLVADNHVNGSWRETQVVPPEQGPVTGGDTGDTKAPVAPRERKDRGRSGSLTGQPTQLGQESSFDGNHRSSTTSPPNASVNLNLDPIQAYEDVAANDTTNTDNELSRGHEGRSETSIPASNPRLGMGKTSAGTKGSTTPPVSPSSILPPILSSPTVPPSYSPHSQPSALRSRPETPVPAAPATSMSISPSTTACPPPILTSMPISGPATADSIRHDRLDSIRAGDTAQTHHGRGQTPTRESSLSRSVRFVDCVDDDDGSSSVSAGTTDNL